MSVKSVISSLLALSLQGAAFAHEVELVQFGGAAAQNVVIHIGPVRVPANAAAVMRAPDLTAALSADFAQIGAPTIAEPVAPASSIRVPDWMQRGNASSRVALAGPSSPIFGADCGDLRYRPRIDLPSSMEVLRARLFPLIAATACEYHIPLGLFDALIWQESRYQINARSPKGAIGLAQLMRGTADYLGVSNPWNVVENLRGGARYLRIQIDEIGRYDLALAAYNAGPGRVRPNRRIPRIRETVDYVRKITVFWLAAERQSVARIPPPLPSNARNGFRGAVVADYMSTSSANAR